MSVIGSNVLAGASGQSTGGGGGGGGAAISRSLRFNSGDSSSLTRTPSSAGNRKTFTWSSWVKRSAINGVEQTLFSAGNASLNVDLIRFNSANQLDVLSAIGGVSWRYISSAVYRDPGAWLHCVVAVDTTNSTAADRVKIYINGTRLTEFSTATAPSFNFDNLINSSIAHAVGYDDGNNTYYLDGYLADVHFIDGQALAPTDFGETNTNNLWVPKAFAGTYGPLVDQSQTWSATTTGSFASASYDAPKGFDGSLTTLVVGSSYTISWTGITVNTSLRVYGDGGSSQLYVVLDGVDTAVPYVSGGALGWYTVSFTGTPTLTGIKAVSSSCNFYAIEVDGKLLVDSGISLSSNGFRLEFADNSSNAALGTDTSGNSNTWTVNNLEAAPGAATTVSSATGALPVYNTTDSQGKVKGTGTRTDSNSSYLVLAVPFDAGNTVDVSNSINTNSTTKSFTTSGSFASNASNIFYGSSTDFNGSSSLSTTSTSSDFTFGTGDFTIEYWAQYDDISAGNSQVGDFQTSTTSGGLSTSSSTGIKNNFYPSGQLNFSVDGVTGGSISGLATGTWYHIAIVRENGSVRLYKDGILQATTSNARDVTATYINIGGYYSTGYLRNGQMQDFRVYKGVAKYTSNFTLVGPGNVALQAGTDSLVDTPTNGDTASDTGAGGELTGNYATLNPLSKGSSSTLANGNLEYTSIGAVSATSSASSTIGMSSGKYYWEVTLTSSATDVGVAIAKAAPTGGGFDTNLILLYLTDGSIYALGSNTSYASGFAQNDVVNVALDVTAGKIWWGKNGTWLVNGNPATGANPSYSSGIIGNTWYADCGHGGGNVTRSLSFNFGSRPFAYAAPTGFKCLNTANLPDPTIADGSLYFDTRLYTGNGSTQTISGMNMSPDFVWTKIRSSSGRHRLTDIVRGATKTLRTDGTDAEFVHQNVTAFNSDGFDIGPSGNASGFTYAAWAWDAGDLATTSDTTNYNQSQAWSSNITTTGYSGNWWPANPKTYIFDADTTNYGHANANGGAVTVTLTVNPTITSTSSVTIYGGMQGSGTATVSINGGTAVALTSGSSATTETVVSFSGAVSSIVITKTSSAAEGLLIYGFKIDGKRLLDPGIIPAGSLNSSLYNQSQTWSSGGSISNSGENPVNYTNTFDGIISGVGAAPNYAEGWRIGGNSLATGTSTVSGLNIAFSESVKVRYFKFIYSGSNSDTQFKINNVSLLDGTATTATYQDIDVTSSITSPITSWEINRNAGNNNLQIAGIYIDGKLLVDAGVSITTPSIASTVRANPSAGFSIVSYTGTGAAATIAHNLNAKPELIIVKTLDSAINWTVWHKALAATDYLTLNTTNAKGTAAAVWNSTAPTSSVIHVGTDVGTNKSGDNYIAYCFAPVEGYSRFGSYTGSTAPNFIYTGFTPALVICKRTDANGEEWLMTTWDTQNYNSFGAYLLVNSSAPENTTSNYMDIVSNGFVHRHSQYQNNTPGGSYVYFAFASHPFASNGGLAR